MSNSKTISSEDSIRPVRRFAYPCGERLPKKQMLTQVLCPEQNADGTASIVPVILECQSNPLLGLNFTDFALAKLISSGISPKALAIMKDNRMNGFENEIDAFNDKLAEHASELFNVNAE